MNLVYPLAGGAWVGGAFLWEGDGTFSAAAFLEAEGIFFCDALLQGGGAQDASSNLRNVNDGSSSFWSGDGTTIFAPALAFAAAAAAAAAGAFYSSTIFSSLF